MGNGIAAAHSCVTSLYIALAFRDRPFVDLLRVCLKLNGDVDTIAAMAGAIWGAIRGVAGLPRNYIEQLEQHERIAELAAALAEASGKHIPAS